MSNGSIFSSIAKYVLLLIFAVVIFEAGMVISYTIVTGQSPDINKIISAQIDEVSSLINLFHGSGNSTQATIKVNNPDDVARAIQNKSQMNGVNLQTLSAHTNESTRNDKINITITVMAYKTTTTSIGNSSNGSIVIKPNETYSITATAIGRTENGGVTVDINSIVITTIRKLYSNSGNGT